MNNIFRKLGVLTHTRSLILSIIFLVLIIPMVIGASQIDTEVGTKTLVDHGAQEYKDYQRLTDNFSDLVIIFLLKADNTELLVQRDNILALEAFGEHMASQPNVVAAVGLPDMIKFGMAHMTGTPSIPNDETILMMIKDPATGAIRGEFAGLFPDNQHALMSIVAESGIENDDVIDLVDITKEAAANAGFKDATYIVTGNPDSLAESLEKMNEAMTIMIAVATIIMLVILALVFKARNFFIWRWLPLGVVLIGILYTFGIMGFTGVPITNVAIAAFPILIGIGVGFTIQFHDRYDKAMSRGESPAQAVIETITHIGPATGIAVVALCLGFAAVLTSPIPMIVDFGYSLIIGTIVMYILGAFLMLPILYWNDYRKERKKTPANTVEPKTKGDGFIEKGLRRLSPAVVRQPAIIILLAIILCVSGYILDNNIDAQTDVLKYMSDDLESVQKLMYLQDLTGGRQHASILVEADNIADPQVLNWMWELQDTIKTNEPDAVGSVSSIADLIVQFNEGVIPDDPAVTEQILSNIPRPITLNLINADLTAANMALSMPGLNADDLRALRDRMAEYISDAPDGTTVAVTGQTILQDKMASGLTGGREKMTFIGIGLILAGLLLLFRFRLQRAIVATLPTVFIIGWAAIVIYLMGIEYSPAGATRGAMSMGIGVMFTILLMNRYYEERDTGQAPAEAITSALVGVGRPIIACGLTVIGGFASLLMATDFPFITDFGIVTLVTVFFGLVSTLIVLPPLTVVVDSWWEKRSKRRKLQ